MKDSVREKLEFAEMVVGVLGIGLMLAAAFGGGLATFAAGVALVAVSCVIEAVVR